MAGPIGQVVTARVAAVIDPDDATAALLDEPDAVVLPLLGGFRLHPVANRTGWHFGHLGLQLGEVERRGGRPCFDVDVTLRPSEAPELFHLGNVGWSYDLDCAYEVDVEWMALVAPAGQLPGQRRSWTTTVHRGLDVQLRDEVVLERPGTPACPCAVGLSGLEVQIGSVTGQRRRSRVLRYHTGRNVRELGLWVEAGPADDDTVRLLPGVAMSNRPRATWLSQLLLVAVVAGSFTAAVLLPGPTVRILFAMFAATLALAGLIWPGGPWAFPAGPWSLHASTSSPSPSSTCR